MKSRIKFMVIGTAVIVLLVALLVVLNMSDKGDEEDVSETSAVTEAEPLSRLLYEKDPAAIDSIHIKNDSGEYDIVKYKDDRWFVEEFLGVPHSKAAVDKVCQSAAKLVSQQTIAENASDLAIYGLSSPRAEVKTSFNNGAEIKELLIGSETPSAGLTYACIKGQTTVFTVNTSEINPFLEDKFSFVAKTVYSAKQPENENDTTDYSKISKITISRKDIDYDIVLEYDIRQDDDDAVYGNQCTHVITNPVSLDLNPDYANTVIYCVFDLTADEIKAIAPTDEMLAMAGLTDPYCEVSYDITGGDFDILIGDEYYDENGKSAGRYCYVEGIDIIYMFSNDKLPWVDVMPLDISMTMITGTYIYNIDTFEVETPDRSETFKLSGEIDTFAVECDNENVTPSSFKTFYQFFLRAPAEEMYIEDCSEPADITVTIIHKFGADKLEFIKTDDRKTIIRLNGRTSFKCRTSYTNRLIENFEHLLNGEDMIGTW